MSVDFYQDGSNGLMEVWAGSSPAPTTNVTCVT